MIFGRAEIRHERRLRRAPESADRRRRDARGLPQPRGHPRSTATSTYRRSRPLTQARRPSASCSRRPFGARRGRTARRLASSRRHPAAGASFWNRIEPAAAELCCVRRAGPRLAQPWRHPSGGRWARGRRPVSSDDDRAVTAPERRLDRIESAPSRERW